MLVIIKINRAKILCELKFYNPIFTHLYTLQRYVLSHFHLRVSSVSCLRENCNGAPCMSGANLEFTGWNCL